MQDAVAAAGDGDGDGPIASVVIPAYDEEHVIGRCLRRLLEGAPPDRLQVVVVANGCHDDTAGAARRAAPGATVIELDEASKAAALNAGDRAADAFPRVYLDADVELTHDAVVAVVEALAEDGVECAAPACRFELCDRPWFIRRFYDVWARLPYVDDALVGNGVYALTAAGRGRFDRFPELTADDLFVRNRFRRAERRSVARASFLVHPPRTLAGLLAVRERTYRGNAELAGDRPRSPDEATAVPGAFGRVARAMPLSFALYAAVNLAAKARWRARRGAVRWERDESARSAPAETDDARPAIAYLTSRYPAVSHTFVRREVEGLRSAGWRVGTYSVRRVDPDDVLAAADREAARTTRSILPASAGRVVRSQWAALRSNPIGWARALAAALRAGGSDLRRVVWGVFYFAEAVLLWQDIRSTPVRHVHAHFANVAADVARLTAIVGRLVDRRGEPWSWSFTMHGPTELADVTAYDLAAKVRDAAGVICISDHGRSQLMGLVDDRHWGKLHVVHCGVDLERFAPVDRSGRAAAAPFRMLCVGRLVPEKGQALLVDATAALRERGVDAHLVLAGDGPQRHELARRADPALVTMKGAVSQDDIVALYADADVFVLPSFAEGVPVVLMEAMATELPVVTTAVAGISELVEHGRSGLVLPPGRLDVLVDALADLAAAPARRRELGRAGRRAVEEGYEIDACAAAVGRVLADLAAPGPPPPAHR